MVLLLTDIEAARERCAPYVDETPTIASPRLSAALRTDVRLKLEFRQVTGSFKPRGAVNSILLLSDKERSRGVCGASGGNFAIGLAYASSRLGVDTLLFMPERTPRSYLDAAAAHGATIELVPDIVTALRSAEEAGEAGRTFLHPFDGAPMMTGNAGLGLELMDQHPATTDVVVSVGGGGLYAGVASALAGRRPDIRVWTVETAGADVLGLSLAAGHMVRMLPTSHARTLGSPTVAEAAWALATSGTPSGAGHTVVSDGDALRCLLDLRDELGDLVELAASSTLAAARRLGGRLGESVVLILCGGNITGDELTGLRAELGVRPAP